MAYQATVDFIRKTANKINPNGTFVHGRTWDVSLQYDKPGPHIYLYPFSTDIDATGGMVSTSTIAMGFYFQDKPDSSLEEREEIIAEAEALCKKFIVKCLDEDDFDISAIRTEPQYRKMTGTYSGYVLSFRLKTSESLC